MPGVRRQRDGRAMSPADSRDMGDCERRAGFCERCGYRRCQLRAHSTPATPAGLPSDANIDLTARTLEALADELSETLGARAQEGGGGGSEAERELLRAFTRVLAALQPLAGEGE